MYITILNPTFNIPISMIVYCCWRKHEPFGMPLMRFVVDGQMYIVKLTLMHKSNKSNIRVSVININRTRSS
jgi:hypothetical protein